MYSQLGVDQVPDQGRLPDLPGTHHEDDGRIGESFAHEPGSEPWEHESGPLR